MHINNRAFTIWLLGSISGFTIMISGNSLNYWLAKDGIDIKTIGMFAFILLPYSINFIWAPVFDTKRVNFLSNLLGDRLSWILVIAILLALFVLILGLIDPHKYLFQFAICALCVSFLSSTQDGLLGALKTELISKEDQGRFSGMYIFGYRIGMLISGSFAIYLSSFLSFSVIYQYFAAIILLKVIILIAVTKNSKTTAASRLEDKIITHPLNFIHKILKPIGSPSFVILIVFFLIAYRLADNFINMMINPFLIKLGFSAMEIATTGKFCGVIGAIIGGFIASNIMKTRPIINSLLIFGIIHAVAHSLFIVQELYGNNIYLLFIVIGFESVTSGMSMAAYIAFIASLCHGRFRATQYSFFLAMMGASRAVLPAISGYIVSLFGWNIFFCFTTIVTIPSLILLCIFKNIYKIRHCERI
jgi:MFS transporter, PAT family, beta-lactamase induction signal transducer AmpG